MTAIALRSPLVSTQWLADHLGADDLVLLDASVVGYTQPSGRPGYLSGHEEYLVHGHIPGAVFADLIHELSDPDGPYPFTRPDAARLSAAAGALGIGPDTTVVIYDGAVGQWASRLWWLLRAAGHDAAAVLDGGLTKWTAEGRVVDTGHVEPRPAEFAVQERPELWAERADIEAVLDGSAEASLVCAIPPKEFSGEVVTRARGGHIPGSVSLPAGRLVDRTTNAVLPAAQLRDALGVEADAARYIVYCAGGIAATAAALALTVLGKTDIAVYDNSLNEWAGDPSLPLTTAA